MKVFFYILICTSEVFCYEASYFNRDDFCAELKCDEAVNKSVCGIKERGQGFSLRLFKNECALMKHGCLVNENEAYGLINKIYCTTSFSNDNRKNCGDCTLYEEREILCAIREDGDGFRIKIFPNQCELTKYNCENNSNFVVAKNYICQGLTENSDNKPEISNADKNKIVDMREEIKQVIVVDGSILGINKNINESIDNFFAATHVLDLPMKEFNESTRRRLIRVFGPSVVFKPWITKPKNISEDFYHMPTLSSCYHKCPKKCPDTYAPVCGVPGVVAREPSLMFQNHCFMDLAQCKMFWEDKSPTSQSSAYIESSFIFCLGDELNGLYRFLPLVRTLQNMGRLKKKGHFRYKFRNMRFFNNFMIKEPKFIG